MKTFLWVLISVEVYTAFANVNLNTSIKDCPLWTTLQNNSCKCGSNISGLVQCEDERGAFAVSNCYCMTTDKNNDIPLVGACHYNCHLLSKTNIYNLNVNTTQDLDNATCGPQKRTGVLCGECIEGYGLPVYSYSPSCVECSHYKYNWLKYIAVAYIPLTLFYAVIVLFRVSATSGLMAGYITTCQILSMRRLIMWSIRISHYLAFQYIISLISIWNLDFFRFLYSPFCLHPKLSALHVFMLDYAVALYPLMLILLTYLAVKLHDQFRLVVWLGKPLYMCLHRFRKEWNIKNSLVEAFATFYILSYVKVLNTSADLLKFVHVINMNFQKEMKHFYEPTLTYFGDEHYPYAIIAIVFTVLFNLLPFLLLCLYPCPCFHRCLNKTGCRWQALHVFMDAILGSYSHRPRERRYFGTVYIMIRVLHLLASTMNPTVYLPIACYIMIVAIVLVSIFQPYRNKWHNVIDVVLFSAVLHCCLVFIFDEDVILTDPYVRKFQSYAYRISLIVTLIIPIYGTVMLFVTFLPKKSIRWLLARLARIHWRRKNIQLDESLPYRMEHGERNPLI